MIPPTVAGLAGAYRARETDPVEVVDLLLARIEEVDPRIGAFTAVLAERAREEAMGARRLLAGDDPPPLAGIPVGVKEIIDVADAPVTYGSEVFAGRVAADDAEVVARLRRAGGIVMGLTRTHEVAWGITTQHARLGSTRNPWDLGRVPGGSSGGSAAAVAAGLVPLALGSDTGGSIRIPAAFCGVCGIKPAYERVPTVGVLPLATSLDHVGPLARTVGDLTAALSVLADPPPDGLAPPPGGAAMRVAVSPDLHAVVLDPAYAKAFDGLLDSLADAGHRVGQVGFPEADAVLGAFTAIQRAEALHVHQDVLGTFPDRAADYGPDVRSRLQASTAVGLADYLEAREVRRRVRRRFRLILAEEADVLVTPVSAGPPSTVEQPDEVTHAGERLAFRDLVMGYTVPQDLAGVPAVSVPIGLDPSGLPIGVQVTAATEGRALAFAAAIEDVVAPVGEPRLDPA